ncbi:nucleoside/nucleotide kinase family protein [Microbacterium gorillae]|uniref:aminobenzoate synthetase n=1 Tax=Microbacterium gorillae TaxID=1231063 RepID=UPI00058C6D62|nr:aminobenzoate synthetase [Microbacterium gorillae]
MPSSADPLDEALTAATAQILSAVARVGVPAPVVLLDGRSGAGKTSLAARLARAWTSGDVQVLALDSVYPGWDGLARGAEIVRGGVLVPHRDGVAGRWNRWDWARDEPAEEHVIDPARPLIVEGSGVLTRASAELADVTVWVDAPDDERRERALERDGDTYRPHWQQWAAQEDAHLASDHPRDLADIVISLP